MTVEEAFQEAGWLEIKRQRYWGHWMTTHKAPNYKEFRDSHGFKDHYYVVKESKPELPAHSFDGRVVWWPADAFRNGFNPIYATEEDMAATDWKVEGWIDDLDR